MIINLDTDSKKWSNKHKSRLFSLITAIISTILSFLIVEFLLARYYPQNTLNSANVFSPFCFRNSDYLPFQLQENSTCKQIQKEFNITVQTNSQGYRNQEFELSKPEDKKRILVLGDSFTFGYGVEDNQVFPYLLENKLNQLSSDWEVINAAYAAGDSPDSYYAYLQNQGYQLNPDIIIETLFVGNDFTDLFETKWLETDAFDLPIKLGTVDRLIDNQGRLLHPQMPINFRIPILKNSHLFQLIYDRLEPKIKAFAFRLRKILKIEKNIQFTHPQPHVFCIYDEKCIKNDNGLDNNFEKILQLLKATSHQTKAKDIRFVVLIIPSDFQIYPNAWKKWGTNVVFENKEPQEPQARLVYFLDKINIEYLDLLTAFKNHPKRLYYPQDAHFNPNGHEYTAELIYEYLKTNLGNNYKK